MARIYTRSGDKGTTALIGGERVAKNDPRVEAYGCVDELGAHIALLSDYATEVGLHEMVELLDQVAVRLMTMEAELALSEKFEGTIGRIESGDVEALERSIDHYSATLPPFAGFTIPGGHRVISQCHICRTVCRRCERHCVTLSQSEDIDPMILKYLNRLSDYLYVLSRKLCLNEGEECFWDGK